MLNEGYLWSHKRADDLFFRSNQNDDLIIDQKEFVHMYLMEVQEIENKRKLRAEN